MNELHYLRINGTISRETAYRPGHGFQTTQIPRCFQRESDPHAPGGYTMSITDSEGKQAWEGIPILDGGSNDVPGRWNLRLYPPAPRTGLL